jgi:hypothetical protein
MANSNELVIIARLADHYEGVVRGDVDALDVAAHDVAKIKREAPQMWARLWASDLDARAIGDRLFAFVQAWKTSGMSFRNYCLVQEETSS